MALAPEQHHEDCDFRVSSTMAQTAEQFGLDEQHEIAPCNLGCEEFTTYDVALIVSIPATSYDEALTIADKIAAGLGSSEELSVSAQFDYEHDNDGQRVLYLHPENEPSGLTG